MGDIRKIKRDERRKYDLIGSVYSPALKENVKFTAQGFHHLTHKKDATGKQRPRKIAEQYLKLSILKYAPVVVAKCKKAEAVRYLEKNVKGKTKNVIHYALVYMVSTNVQVRVIIEKTGNGAPKFLSVMPHDKKSKSTKKRPYRRS